MNMFEDKAFVTASIKSILGHFGKLVYSRAEVPANGKVVRVNQLGFTLTETTNKLLPIENSDMFIGRQQTAPDELAFNDFVIFSRVNDQDHYLYITSDMIGGIHVETFGKYYAYVNNHKNYHAMWFRATIDKYKEDHAEWAINTDKTFADLKPHFDSHYALAMNLGINRFIPEMTNLEDFYCWAGFINPTSKTRYN